MRTTLVGSYLRSPAPKRIDSTEFSVKKTGVRGQVIERLIIHIEILVMRLLALVDKFHHGTFVKRHRHVAVQRAALVELVGKLGGCREQDGLIRSDQSVAQPEEI